MEGILRSIITAGYRQLEARGLVLYRYDPLSDSFPDSWGLEMGEVTRRYSARIHRDGVTGQILRAGEPLVVNDTEQMQPPNRNLPEGIRSFVGVPVLVGGVPWGVLLVNSASPNAFREDDLAFVQSVARQIGIFVESTRDGSSGNVELSTVRVLAATVDAKDHYTRNHSTNVSFYARLLAREMNLDPAEIRRVDLAGLLHDIGKIAIPDQILQKPGRLSEEERLLIQTHAAIGANILAQASHMSYLVPLVRHHHERYDGKGYPDRLAGSEIPLGAAILNLADSFDTMTTRRVYRDAMTLDQTMAEIRRCSGTQFHPDVVAAMESVVAKARFAREPWLLALGSSQAARPGLPEQLAWPGAYDEPTEVISQSRDPMDFLVEAHMVQQYEDLPPMLARGGEMAMSYWEADSAQIYLVDQSQGLLRLAWCNGVPELEPFADACREEGAVPMAHGLLGWALLTNQSIILPDARRDPRWPYSAVCDMPVSVLVTPIVANGAAVGIIQLVIRGESRFGRSDVKVMKVFSSQLGQAIDRVQTALANREAHCTDSLTGVRNPNYLRALMDRLEREPLEEPISVAYLDGDDLKRVNDRWGHQAGDAVIQHIARCLMAWRRPGDEVIRYAGDEFMVVFPGLTLPEAAARLERMRMAVSETPVELPCGYRLFVSVSCGVTEVDDQQGPFRALRGAEQAMYNAKRTGKNRVWTAAS